MDETTELCDFILPTHHYLESWGDAEAKTGAVSFQQPTIYPLFKTRPFQTSLLKWSGNNTEYETYFKTYWSGKLGSEDALNAALQLGVKEDAAAPAGAGAYSGAAVAEASAAITAITIGKGAEVVLYQKTSIGTGTGATNPWLQELPDGITKATWDNYALISLTMAKELLKLNLIDGTEKESNNYEYFPQKPVIKLTVVGANTNNGGKFNIVLCNL